MNPKDVELLKRTAALSDDAIPDPLICPDCGVEFMPPLRRANKTKYCPQCAEAHQKGYTHREFGGEIHHGRFCMPTKRSTGEK